MFYFSYLRSELLRRRGRTILTLLGLALGVALVIVISALSRGLDRAQKTALNPLSSIGTDLTVTLAAQPGPGGFVANSAFDNRSVLTDLSKLGKPGQHFVHDFFLSGTQPTFAQSQAKLVASLPGVAKVSTGLTLTVQHQEGKVPKITATLKSGGQKIQVSGHTKPPSAAELARMAACLAKAGAPGTKPGASNQNPTGGSLTGSPIARDSGAALQKCMLKGSSRFSKTVTVPIQTVTKQLKTPKTDIKTSTFTIGGVDTSQSGMGLITPSQVTKGHFLTTSAGFEALVADSYASSHKLKVGSTLNLNGTKFKVVGVVEAPLGGQSADVYLPLARLQTLADQKNQINVVLVRASKSSAVAQLQKAIEKALPRAQVASSQDVAKQISGSLKDASNLSKSLGLALSIVAIATAFLLAALLTLSSITKRVREIGTLRAIGWTRRLVIRQIAGESFAQGIAGGVLGVALGAVAAAFIDAFGPTLSASSTVGASDRGPQSAAFGLGQTLTRTATSQVSLKAPLAFSLILIGFALALAGGLVAGAIGSLRAARLRPADALRQVE